MKWRVRAHHARAPGDARPRDMILIPKEAQMSGAQSVVKSPRASHLSFIKMSPTAPVSSRFEWFHERLLYPQHYFLPLLFFVPALTFSAIADDIRR